MKCIARILILLVAFSVVAHTAEAGAEIVAHADAPVAAATPDSADGDQPVAAPGMHECHLPAHLPALAPACPLPMHARSESPLARPGLRLTSVDRAPVTPPPTT